MTPSALRAWRAVHRWTSLICTVNLLVLCVTGLILVFHHEIEELTGDHLDTAIPAGAERLPVEALTAVAQRSEPSLVPRFVSFSAEDPAESFVFLAPASEREFENGRWFVLNAFTGAAQALKEPEKTFTGFMLKLHVDLFAGFAGQMFVGVMGLLFVVSTVSGLVVYGPFMKKLAFGVLRFGRQTRIASIDLHNLFGVSTLVWAFVVGLTGAILSFSPLIIGVWQNTELAHLASRHQATLSGAPVSPDVALRAGAAAFPDKEVAFVAYPGNMYTTDRHYGVVLRGHSELTQRLLSIALVDGETGRVVETADMPWYISVLLFSGPFHFGDYGGLPLQIIWALFTIVLGVVTVSGLIVWLKRPRGRTAAAPAAVPGSTPSEGQA